MPKKFYITTAIDYVNSLPHIGTAYEKIGADALARFHRMDGESVHFQMGNDEHSVNVKKSAEQQGLQPKVYCDEMRKKFEAIWEQLEISNDDFIQTSEPRHHEGVKRFLGLLDKSDVEIRNYEGWYCESCEAFQTEKDLVDGKCPTHKTQPKWLQEKNYFFLLSKYQDRLLKHYEQHPEFILPEIRRNEIVSLVKSGLQDISISRAGFSWGIPFPNDPSHVVYVWFDALINYLSAIGFGDDVGANLVFAPGRSQGSPLQWWPADIHVIGKDITRFHCVIWPAMLMSAKLPLPKTVFGHGFVFLKGEKMSKSLGNIVTPLDIVPKYGADALRYYLLRESSFGSDGDFTWDNFIKRYNSDLANDLGNVLNRTLGMVNKYLGGTIAAPPHPTPLPKRERELQTLVESTLDRVRKALDPIQSGDIDFHAALAEIWKVIAATDKYIDSSAPWQLFKEGKRDEIEAVLYHAADSIRNIALLVAPFLPGAAEKIWEQLELAGKLPFKKQSFKNVAWGKTPVPLTVKVGEPIFPRIEITSGSPLPGGEGIKGRVTGATMVTPTLTLPPQGGGNNEKEKNKMEPTELLDIADFAKVQLRVAEVKQAEKVEGADRLLKLQIDVGGEPRQIVAGIAQHYTPEQIIGKKVVVVANLKPAKIRGVESNGMLLAASDETGLSILVLDRPALASGAKVK